MRLAFRYSHRTNDGSEWFRFGRERMVILNDDGEVVKIFYDGEQLWSTDPPMTSHSEAYLR